MMASTSAGSGWTTSRIIALVAGSVLLLISLAFIAGGGTLAWADQEQLHSGYVTTSTTTYSTSGYALVSDPIKPHGTWGWLACSLTGPGSGSPRPTGPARSSWVSPPPVTSSATWATSATRRWASVADMTSPIIRAPGSLAPATALRWAAQAQGTGILSLTWEGQRGDWMVVVMNPDASSGLTVRAEAGIRPRRWRGWPASC